MTNEIEVLDSNKKVITTQQDQFADIETIIKSLSDKEKKFCQQYCKCLNNTKAAIKAGYSQETACVKGYQIKQRPYCSKYISFLLNSNGVLNTISVQWITNQFIKIYDNTKSQKIKIQVADRLARMKGAYKQQPLIGGGNEITINVTKKDNDN